MPRFRIAAPVAIAALVGLSTCPLGAQPSTGKIAGIVRVASGWFAWDAYRDDTPWRAVWFVGGRAGRYDVGWPKMIATAAVSPLGTYAALSLDTRFGRIPLGGEALVLVRLADGKEVFRKKLPRFTRSHVAFLGDRHLVWMEGGGVAVARIPEGPPDHPERRGNMPGDSRRR